MTLSILDAEVKSLPRSSPRKPSENLSRSQFGMFQRGTADLYMTHRGRCLKQHPPSVRSRLKL
jgi:hypothetical protein